MKYFTNLFLLLLINSFFCEGASITGNLSKFEETISGVIENSLVNWCADSASYINGGITFNYPAGLFSSTPSVRVSLQENGTVYSTNQVFVAEITTNSSTLTTIRVNLITTSTVTEAGNDEVIVHIFAIEI